MSSKLYAKYSSLLTQSSVLSRKDLIDIESAIFRRSKGKMSDDDVTTLETLFYGGCPWDLDEACQKQGLDWLWNRWKTPTGIERRHNPFGEREQAILERPKKITVSDYCKQNTPYSLGGWYVYTVEDMDGNEFEYQVNYRQSPETGVYICG